MGLGEAASSVVIDAGELHHELERSQPPTLLDVRWVLGSDPDTCHTSYLGGHIPGAVFVDLENQLSNADAGDGRHPLPCPDDFERTAKSLGINNDCPVVVYDSGTGQAAARLWWLLTDAGHCDVRVLDGGMAAWRQAGYEIETGEVVPREGRFMADTGNLDVVEADDVDGADVTVWDVRAPERFRGEHEPVDAVAGHIPGSRNLPAANLFREGRLLPTEELDSVCAEVQPGDIISCGSGITASQVIWVLHSIGKTDVALYAGSWSDWISDSDRPIVSDAPDEPIHEPARA